MSQSLSKQKRELETDYKLEPRGYIRYLDIESIKPHGIVAETKKPNKYQRECKKSVIDVYDVLEMFEVTNPASQHAIKKLLMPGKRGAKDTVQDLKEARDSIVRAIELETDRLQ